MSIWILVLLLKLHEAYRKEKVLMTSSISRRGKGYMFLVKYEKLVQLFYARGSTMALRSVELGFFLGK
jgi:hypothetical protein